MYRALILFFFILLKSIQSFHKSRQDLVLENISLRHQLSVYVIKKRQPALADSDRLFWVALRKIWDKWSQTLVIVKPETVVNWQKQRFKRYWKNISNRNKKPGRKKIKREIRDLIYRMAGENRWGAPRIYSELLMLGYSDVSEASVSRYLKRFRSQHPDKQKQQSWMTFLKNHRDVISAMDFFTVPTIRFEILYVFFIIDHGRRKITHLNVASSPCARWVIQQFRDAFPFDEGPRYLIFDRDSCFSDQVKHFLKHQLCVNPKVTAYKSPWQNGIAERFVLSVRNEMLNRVIVFDENHLRRLLKEYIDYYNKDRCHLSLGRDSPLGREAQNRPSRSARIITLPKIGGLHHRYEWRNVV